jgi:hypothetical protein
LRAQLPTGNVQLFRRVSVVLARCRV